jgi:hypothetical protein
MVDSAKRFSRAWLHLSRPAIFIMRKRVRSYAPLAQSPSSKRPTVAWAMLLLSNFFSAAKSHVLISRRYDYELLSFYVTKLARLIYGGVNCFLSRRKRQRSRLERRQPYKFPEESLALVHHPRLSSYNRLKSEEEPGTNDCWPFLRIP